MGGFVHNCYLVAEKINFRYPFIKVSHTLEPYPVIVEADDFPQGTPVGDENELINKLMLIFTSGQTRKIVCQILDALS